MNRLVRRSFPELDDDWATPWTILDGVAYQIEQHLFNASWIDVRHQGGLDGIDLYLVARRRLLQMLRHWPRQRLVGKRVLRRTWVMWPNASCCVHP